MTPGEMNTLRERKEGLDEFISEIRPRVLELAEFSGATNAESYLANPDDLIPILDNFWKRDDFKAITQNQFIWLGTRIMCFIGMLCLHRYGGRWYVQDDPDVDFYLQYVVGHFYVAGHFDRDDLDKAIVAPYEVTEIYMDLPIGRSLTAIIEEMHNSLTASVV
jgi:hypothetical protein